MRVTRIEIENFRSIRYLVVDLGETTVFVGPNNAGKTAILDALRIALTRRWGQRGTGFSEYDIHLADDAADPKTSSGREYRAPVRGGRTRRVARRDRGGPRRHRTTGPDFRTPIHLPANPVRMEPRHGRLRAELGIPRRQARTGGRPPGGDLETQLVADGLGAELRETLAALDIQDARELNDEDLVVRLRADKTTYAAAFAARIRGDTELAQRAPDAFRAAVKQLRGLA